jgi:predicted ABC-type ATPase
MDEPLLVLIGGPNGAGKSTLAGSLLPTLGIEHFVNADDIARGMSDNAESVAISAGRAMIQQLRALQAARESFAFESTLASRSFAKFAADARGQGYRFLLYYVWVPSPEVSVRRVARRVEAGGHNVPEADIRRRYLRSVYNFLSLYSPIADGWIVFENPDSSAHRIVAVGGGRKVHWVSNEQAWNQLRTAGQS